MVAFLLLLPLAIFGVLTLAIDAYLLWLQPELLSDGLWWLLLSNLVVVGWCQIAAWRLNYEKNQALMGRFTG